jgi:hypothetical protein
VDRDSAGGIAIRYGLDGPGIESRWGRDFLHLSRPAVGPTQLLYNGLVLIFPGVKQPGRGVDHPPPSIAEIKGRVDLYLWVFKACPRAKFHDRFYPSC